MGESMIYNRWEVFVSLLVWEDGCKWEWAARSCPWISAKWGCSRVKYYFKTFERKDGVCSRHHKQCQCQLSISCKETGKFFQYSTPLIFLTYHFYKTGRNQQKLTSQKPIKVSANVSMWNPWENLFPFILCLHSLVDNISCNTQSIIYKLCA